MSTITTIASVPPPNLEHILHNLPMEDFNGCRNDMHTELVSAVHKDVEPDDDHEQPNYTINIKLVCGGYVYEDVFDQTNSLVDTIEASVMPEETCTVNLHLDRLEDVQGQKEQVKNMIGGCLHCLSEEWKDSLSESLVQYTTEQCTELPPGHKYVVNLEVQSDFLHIHAVVRREEQQQIGDAHDDVPPRMSPATEESIKSLKSKRVEKDDSDDQECAICLADIPEGSEAVYMPCSHSFHGDCIVKWLNTSHYCPMCRFEMPIDE